MTRLAVIVTALAMSLFAPSAKAARTEFFGIAQGPLDAQDAQGMAEARVHTERFMIKWREVEATQGSYDWSDRDRLIGTLASRGIRPAPFVWGSPTWVGSGAAARPPVDSAADVLAWQNFLKAAVARYGPGGSYWADKYHQVYGASATPLPVQSWQIWNEPNLKKFFSPGATLQQSTQKYARLLQLSHDAIKSKDPKAQIVLAGMPGYGDVTAWRFLNYLYPISGVKADFDAAALHPYGCDLDQTRNIINAFRASMENHDDGATPLWLTELAWGSGPADQFCKNKGLTGQRDLLTSSFKLILQNRKYWNVQRLYWFLWRDPAPGSPYATLCSICGTAGLLNNDRTPKPAYYAFTSFTAETTPPVARIVFGPSEGGFTKDSTPAFYFASNEPGSTFVCHFDAGVFKPCASPLIPGSRLSDGTHTFYVKAIDAPGNESAVVSRSFTVDTVAPATPSVTDTDPNSPANNNAPNVKGSAAAGSTVALYKTVGCTGSPVAVGSPAQFASPGFSVSVADNTTTFFRATARDAAGNVSPCSAARAYVEDSTAPQTTITGGPSGSITDDTPTFSFASSESGSTFKCRFDSDPFAACSGPGASHTPSTPLSHGTHSFAVLATDRAKNTDPTPATSTFTLGP
jgi:hypothetical protein